MDPTPAAPERDGAPPAPAGQRYAEMFASLREVVFQIDRRGNWSFLNDAWTRLLGFRVGASRFDRDRARASRAELLAAVRAVLDGAAPS